jgi:hypothetical protein
MVDYVTVFGLLSVEIAVRAEGEFSKLLLYMSRMYNILLLFAKLSPKKNKYEKLTYE